PAPTHDAGARTLSPASPEGANTANVAPNGSTLTLEQAVHAALAWHPSIDEAVARINQSTAEIDIARAGYYPRVSGGINSSYDSTGHDGWQPRLSLSASQMIYDFGQVSSEVEARTANTAVNRSEFLLG